MAGRAFERFLAESAAAVEAAQQQLDGRVQAEAKRKAEEDALRKVEGGMSAGDAIQRILLAHKDRDYFRCARWCCCAGGAVTRRGGGAGERPAPATDAAL